MFEIDSRLADDTFELGRFELCTLLLHRDANYPWFILVPMRFGISEIHHLTDDEQVQLLRESSALAQVLERVFVPDKLNIAALGNVVPQLHIHHVVRYRTDPAWPAPVWGTVAASDYTGDALQERGRQVIDALQRSSLVSEPRFTSALG